MFQNTDSVDKKLNGNWILGVLNVSIYIKSYFGSVDFVM